MPAAEVTGCAKPFRRLLEDWEPELLLCGLPYTLAGEEGPQAARMRDGGRSASGDAVRHARTRSQTSASARARPNGVCVKRAWTRKPCAAK